MYPRTTFGLLATSSVAIIALFIITAFIIQRPVTERYRDADAVRGALAGEGIFCTGMTIKEPPQPEIGSFGDCRIDGELVEVYVIDIEPARDAWAAGITDIEGFKVLVGENWVLASQDRAALEAARTALDGDLN